LLLCVNSFDSLSNGLGGNLGGGLLNRGFLHGIEVLSSSLGGLNCGVWFDGSGSSFLLNFLRFNLGFFDGFVCLDLSLDFRCFSWEWVLFFWCFLNFLGDNSLDFDDFSLELLYLLGSFNNINRVNDGSLGFLILLDLLFVINGLVFFDNNSGCLELLLIFRAVLSILFTFVDGLSVFLDLLCVSLLFSRVSEILDICVHLSSLLVFGHFILWGSLFGIRFSFLDLSYGLDLFNGGN